MHARKHMHAHWGHIKTPAYFRKMHCQQSKLWCYTLNRNFTSERTFTLHTTTTTTTTTRCKQSTRIPNLHSKQHTFRDADLQGERLALWKFNQENRCLVMPHHCCDLIVPEATSTVAVAMATIFMRVHDTPTLKRLYLTVFHCWATLSDHWYSSAQHRYWEWGCNLQPVAVTRKRQVRRLVI